MALNHLLRWEKRTLWNIPSHFSFVTFCFDFKDTAENINEPLYYVYFWHSFRNIFVTVDMTDYFTVVDAKYDDYVVFYFCDTFLYFRVGK